MILKPITAEVIFPQKKTNPICRAKKTPNCDVQHSETRVFQVLPALDHAKQRPIVFLEISVLRQFIIRDPLTLLFFRLYR